VWLLTCALDPYLYPSFNLINPSLPLTPSLPKS
jgi:hypothetical protein